jgi:hypothetical protein
MAKRPVSADPALEVEPEVSTAPGEAVVTFLRGWGAYNAGESASFHPEDAARLVEAGVAQPQGANKD